MVKFVDLQILSEKMSMKQLLVAYWIPANRLRWSS